MTDKLSSSRSQLVAIAAQLRLDADDLRKEDWVDVPATMDKAAALIESVLSETRRVTVEIPEGWQIVPKEPTQEMVNALHHGTWEGEKDPVPGHIEDRLWRQTYRAALAVAPKLVSVKEFVLSEREEKTHG